MTTKGRPKTQPDRAELANEMVARVLSESIRTFSQARSEIQQITGQRPDRATILRWHKRGCGGIRLDAARIGRDYLTSMEALTRFIKARTEAGL
jgi:hypothetical protein